MTGKLSGFLMALVCTTAWGQTAPAASVSQVFRFTYVQAPRDMQQITNAVRTMSDIRTVDLDPAGKTLTVTATPPQVAMATWIFSALDQPAPANGATREFRTTGFAHDTNLVRVLYSRNSQTPASFQELVNAVRTIPELTYVFPFFGEATAIVVRGTDSQIDMSEWLFHQMDVPAGVQAVQSVAAHQLPTPGRDNDQTQVLFLSHPWTTNSMLEIVNAVRVTSMLTKVFPGTATGAIAMRGQPATLALAAWLFEQLDRSTPATGTAPAEYQMPAGADDVTQVFYLSAANMASLPSPFPSRGSMPRTVFQVTTSNALVMRGTATQIAAADLLLKQSLKP